MPKPFNFSFINLGCTKNLVDSQYLLGHLFDIGANNPHYAVNYFTDPFDKNVEFVFLNTCGFIESGRKEADEMVRKLLKANKTVYMMGCAVQYDKRLKNIRVGLIDNGSSYINDLSQTLCNFGYEVHILSSGQRDKIHEDDYDLFVLSGMKHGRSVMRHAELYKKEISFVKTCSKPLLGICLGHEIICKAFDSTIVQLPQKQVGTHTISFNKNTIFKQKKANVYEGHIFGVKTLGPQLRGIAKSTYGYEIVQHKSKPIFGFQFHPEQTKEGIDILVQLLRHVGLVTNTSSQLHYLSRSDLDTMSLKDIMQGYNSTKFNDFRFSTGPRVYTNIQERFEYLKIAEGCDNRCTFCIIPKIRGKQRSLPIEKVLEEAKQMIKAGIHEIILIAQDTTRYGTDLYGKPALFELLEKLDKLPGDFKYRILYLYPDVVTLKQLEKLTKLQKFIPYFDIPLQHIASPVLKRMGRFYDEQYILKFLDHIKKLFLTRFIRTNLIIGFPGETKQDFKQLKKFVQEQNFDNIALFEYHDEPFAASSNLNKKVGDLEIRRRFGEIKKIVDKQFISNTKKRIGEQEVGYIMNMEKSKNGKVEKLTIRPRLHAPEIDSYDHIKRSQVLATFDSATEANIGDRIVYIV